MLIETFLPLYQQAKLKRNGVEKLLNVNLIKFKISDNLFVMQGNHNLFLLINLFFCDPASFNFPLNLRHSQNFPVAGKVHRISSALNIARFFI